MIKKIFPAIALVTFMASCSSIKPLSFTNKQQSTTPSQDNNKNEVKFLDISSDNDDNKDTKSTIKKESSSGPAASTENNSNNSKSAEASKTLALQLKYSQLMNTDAQQVQNIPLYQSIDSWYGAPYRYGGTTKDGIDCSAFVESIFMTAFGITLPRTAREQYKATRHISRTELQEGDLLFFNTRGGVSHVGIYLQNNKFVHASVSGVTISDMFEPYYVKHFIAAGRVAGINNNSSVSINP
jgi:lipoprotein Spr